MKKGDLVRVWLQQGINAEGIVHRVKKRHLILKSVENNDKLVINNPQANIIMWRKINPPKAISSDLPSSKSIVAVVPGQSWAHRILGTWEVVDHLPPDTVTLMNKIRTSEIINLSLNELFAEWVLVGEAPEPEVESTSVEEQEFTDNMVPYVPDLSLRAAKLSELKQLQVEEIKKKVEKRNEFSPNLDLIKKRIKDAYESPSLTKQLPLFNSREKTS